MYSGRLDTHVHFGRLPDDRRKARVTLRAPGGIPAPDSADWMSPVAGWNMALNDELGDCTAAGMGHTITAVEKVAQLRDVVVPDDQTLAMYEAISGYRPGRPETDVGATLQDALDYARKTGLAGVRVTAFAQIDASDLNLVRACIAYFGAVYAGMNFPGSAMDQFDNHLPWNVVKRAKIEGGHCVPLLKYDAQSFTCVTWGRPQAMGIGFYQRYFDEIWVPIFSDWMEAAGVTPSGLDATAANADFQSLTGSSETPFGAVEPAPTPAPGELDEVFAAAAREWLAGRQL